MPYELTEVKDIRRKLGITQSQLARHAGVSQSIIAKIESGRIDPAYSKTVKIFRALDEMSKKKEMKAEGIMHKKVISLKPGDSVKDAVRKMKRYDISQMPVLSKNSPVGLVSESTLLKALTEGNGGKISDIMEDSPPVVTKQTAASVISYLLKFYPIVLVSEKGALLGLITKSDMIRKI